MVIKIENYDIEIMKHNTKNTFIGKFLNDSTMQDVYGDSFYEVICDLEKVIRERNNKNELCRN